MDKYRVDADSTAKKDYDLFRMTEERAMEINQLMISSIKIIEEMGVSPNTAELIGAACAAAPFCETDNEFAFLIYKITRASYELEHLFKH